MLHTFRSRWVAVTVTVSAAVVTHAAASRYDYQQLEFSRTAAELEFLHAQWAAMRERTPESDDAFVTQCEHVISVQNEGWMAKWSEEAEGEVSRSEDAR
ncbi:MULTISPECIES: SLATT domain-containing protein [unclassified Streptomyces]|uniref:SLATT domain-containing protein n=1 Tax=unclassified Streptomyces TaxID=2593676 RepID=UPI004042E900